MPNQVTVEGKPELHRALTGLEGSLRDLSPLNAEVAGDLARAISALAPRDTGALADSFEPRGTREGAEVTSELAYAGPQNYGVPSHNIAPTHYAERALAASEPAAGAKYESGLARLTRKAES